ncbi:MAG: TetR/AcrR family transcriptional regulator [Candidatus Latescibacterota bacterium]
MAAETRRAREKAMRRRELLDAAKRMFAQKGYAATTIDEIAQEADFSKGAMYGYFEGKEDLFFSLIQEKLDDIERRSRRVIESSDDPKSKIMDLVETHLAFFEEDKDFFRIIVSEQPRLEMEAENRLREHLGERCLRGLDLIEKVMQDGVSAGVLKEIDPRFLATGLVGIIHAFTAQWILLGGEEGLMERKSVILELFLNGAEVALT